jgi:protein NrfD
MPEITVVGENSLMTWGWEIALYLFLGGLTAGLMIFSGAMRLGRPGQFRRALFVADLAGLPLLGIGMLCLFLDLSNKINVWRFYTAFQISSAMSWGAWILLLTMLVLAVRFVSRVPAPKPVTLLGLRLFTAPTGENEEEGEKTAVKTSPLTAFVQWGWQLLAAISRWAERSNRVLALIGALLGIGVGFYTGVLLSTIPSRPLWNTAILAPLFLVSGLASGGAFLCLFLPEEEHRHLVPFSILFCGIEILLLLALSINLIFGNSAAQRAGTILFNGVYGWAFWGLVFLFGLLVPAVLEQMELLHRRIPFIPARIPPVLKLVGSLALRFVIVYAGVASFM